MGCSIKGNGKEGTHIGEDGPTGLIMNHAYGLNDIIELENPKKKGEKIRLLRIRNPWGNSEWNGAWGAGSEELEDPDYKKVLEDYIKSLPVDEQFELEDDDGTFFMDYDEWKDIFSQVFLNVDFPDEWTGVRFKSAWTSQNSGGLPNKMQESVLRRYAKNPQFFIKASNDTELLFAMQQTGGRLPVNGKYHDYPFKEVLNFANVSVFRLEEGQQYLDKFNKKAVEFISPVKRERENAGRLMLKAGQSYVIIPSCETPDTTGEVYLSLYCKCELRDIDIKRVFHPDDRNIANDEILPSLIPEEAEKLNVAAPTWKLELVRESLPYIIGSEDTGVMDV